MFELLSFVHAIFCYKIIENCYTVLKEGCRMNFECTTNSKHVRILAFLFSGRFKVPDFSRNLIYLRKLKRKIYQSNPCDLRFK